MVRHLLKHQGQTCELFAQALSVSCLIALLFSFLNDHVSAMDTVSTRVQLGSASITTDQCALIGYYFQVRVTINFVRVSFAISCYCACSSYWPLLQFSDYATCYYLILLQHTQTHCNRSTQLITMQCNTTSRHATTQHNTTQHCQYNTQNCKLVIPLSSCSKELVSALCLALSSSFFLLLPLPKSSSKNKVNKI